MDAGSVIREARQGAGITQRELARRLGVTQPAIAQLERHGSNPRMATFTGVLEALGQGVYIAHTTAPVDLTQLDAHLALTPAERLVRHDRARSRMRTLTTGARRV